MQQTWVQKQTKEHNRGKIIRLLHDKPKRFTDLREESGFSPRGLTTMLKDLVANKKIEKIIHEGKETYALTKKGEKSFLELSEISFIIDLIQKGGGSYHQGYSNIRDSMWFCRFPWGIQDDLVLDKRIGEKLNPLTKDFVMDLQNYLFKKLRENVKNKKIQLDKTKEGNIILGFIFDYKELVESIEKNSLEHYNNVTEEELDVFERFELGTFTDEDVKKLQEIMKKR